MRGATVTLVEDVLTTGGAARAATLALRELGATVEHTLCVIDRSETPGGPLQDVGLETRSVLTRADLDGVRAAR